MTKTLILAQGLELARLLAAVNKHAANRVVVIRNTQELTQKLAAIVQKLLDNFEKEIFSEREGFRPFPSVTEVDSKTQCTNFFNLPEATSAVYSIVMNETKAGNDVVVDVSSGTKIMSIAMFLAAQLCGVPVSYCIAGKYTVEDTVLESPQRAQIAAASGKAYDVPRFPLKLVPVSFELLERLATTPDKEVSSITDLVSQSRQGNTRGASQSDSMSIRRDLDTLHYYDYVRLLRPPGQKNTKVMLTKNGEKIIALKVLEKLFEKG